MEGKIKTKRWCDPIEKDDGFRLLICRYRPRALPKKDENWTLWRANLGPSRELHAAYYGKNDQTPLTWEEYERRYLEEMKEQAEEIDFLAEMVAGGKTLTLLCSSACEDASTCHRTLLAKLIKERLALHPLTPPPPLPPRGEGE
jgi:uncharacterized protein YeaO (DUF488 family)